MDAEMEIIDLTSPKQQIHEIQDLEPELEQREHTASAEVNTDPEGDAGAHAGADVDADREGGTGADADASPLPRKKRVRKRKRSSLNPAAAAAADQDTPARTPTERQPPTEPRGKRKRRGESPVPDGNDRAARRARRSLRAREEEQKGREEEGREDGENRPPTDEQLFFVDLAPVPSATGVPATTEAPAVKEEGPAKLLVPAHVTVLGSTPVEIVQPLEAGEMDEDFINYLDYDDSKHMTRYYDEPKDESEVLTRTVCKKCGAEGDHKTFACTVLICLTCGLRNEHSTRSCPISKVCFTCGMKGHINANCPNRGAARAFQSSREVECDRCSSSNHQTNECPTVWRLYEYYSVEEQAHVISARQSKKELKLGEGGEGFIADDEWCYYCGQSSHWGDDCYDMEQPPYEHSAFSRYNVMHGPFFDPTNERKASTSRSSARDWSAVDDSWGKNAPGDVGRKGRMKSRAKLEKQAAEQAADDPLDWFNRPAASSSTANGNSGKQRDTSKPFTFGKGLGAGKQFVPPPPREGAGPSLLARLDKGREDGKASRRSRRSEPSRNSESLRRSESSRKPEVRDSSYYRDRRRRDERDRAESTYYDIDNPTKKSGPRYRGGYIAR